MEALLAAGRRDELRARLCSRMSFGTAGLRAPMGAGFSRINDLTVIQSTQVPPCPPPPPSAPGPAALKPCACDCPPGLALVPDQPFPRRVQQRGGGRLRRQRTGGERLQQPTVSAHTPPRRSGARATCEPKQPWQRRPEARPAVFEGGTRGIVIGRCRSCHLSSRLAKLTAAVLLSRDVPVHLFSVFVPTPYVVRRPYCITFS